MNTKKYFCVEWKRCFQSLYIYAGVVGAWVMWMYSTQGETMGDVLNCFMLTSQSAGIILVFYVVYVRAWNQFLRRYGKQIFLLSGCERQSEKICG